ncbi:MAG TPA: MmgE/PrpD family protein [Candidatus Dormibacteraeota bacterium]|nr:MmgE/PrpD family protein [Candidatus Dormibacteraeota bacterium]
MLRRDFFHLAMFSGLIPLAMRQTAKKPAASSFPHVKGLTRYVVEFISKTDYNSIPSDVIQDGKKDMLDGFGLALAGSAATTGHLSRKYIDSLCPCPSSGQATVAGTAMKANPRFATFLNGISIHAFDFDDTQLALGKDRVYGLLMHPTVTALAPAFALAEAEGKSGKDLMLAYQLGVEVACKIAQAISPRSYEDGFHTTGVCGPFGATAAGLKLLGLDLDQSLNAFGVAGAEGSGLTVNFGTMTKPFHAGHAGESGIVAVDLAALGWTAAHDILEAPGGFFHAYGGSYDPGYILNKLGNPWTFANPGVSIKPFPCGSLTHPGMDEMLRLIRQNNITPGEVESVDVGTNRHSYDTLIRHDPQTGLEAKFSMEFCMAILLLERKAGLTEFTDAVVRRPDVQAMIRRVHYSVSPVAEAAGFNKMTTIIHIHLKDGRTISGRADFAKGSPQYPMSYDEVADKFRGNADFAHWPKDKTEKIIETVSKLESVADVRELTPLLSA